MAIKLTLSDIRFKAIVLVLLARTPSQILAESDIIALAERSGFLSADMKASVRSRSDSRFANKLHNEISHRTSRNKLIHTRHVGWIADGASLVLLDKGRKLLADIATRTNRGGIDDVEKVTLWLRALTANEKGRPD